MSWENIKADTEKLIKLREYDVLELERQLGSLINADGFETSLKASALVDCLIHVVIFSTEKELNDEEFVELLRLQVSLLQNCEEKISFEDNIKFFRKQLMVSDEDDEYIYKIDHMKSIIDFMIYSFFQHYELYIYLFSCEQDIEEMRKQVFVDLLPIITPFPAPLEESISHEDFELHVSAHHVADEEDEENVNEDLNSTEQISKLNACNDVTESTADLVLSSIDRGDVKEMINKLAKEKLSLAKAELESKICKKESAMLKTLNKLQAS